MRKTMVVRTPYNYDRFAASLESGLACSDESRTVQSEKDDADINVLVRRFGLTGMIPQNVRAPIADDFCDVFDFSSAMQGIRTAQESFEQLGSDVRERFRNDPELFVKFCLEEKDGKLVNIDEMRKFGLALPAKPETVPESVPAVKDTVK